jgi:hypothetical protein
MEPTNLSANGFCQGLCEAVRTSKAVPETFAVNLVPVAHQIPWRCVFREGFQDLLSSPSGGPMLGHLEMKQAAPMVSSSTSTKRTRKVAVGTVKKSTDTSSLTWLSRKLFQL